MNRMFAWFATNGVAANLLMLAIVAGGYFTVQTIKTEVFPEMQLDIVTITVPFPGGTPADIEDSICEPIEREIESVDGIKRITAAASEGAGIVTVELETGANIRDVLDRIRTRVDSITSFPEQAEKAIVTDVIVRNLVLNVAVHGQTTERTIKELGEQVRREISRLNGISLVEITSVRPYEMNIEVSEDALRRYRLSFDQVVAAIRTSSLDLPAGSIDTTGGQVLIRTTGQARSADQFAQIPVIARADGQRVLLGQVASIDDGFAETDQSAMFNGEPAAIVQVFRVADQNALDVAASVHDYVQRAQQRLPEGITLTVWRDESTILQSRIATLTNNGISGLLLVLLVLALFLDLKLALWVSLGILISLVGSLMVMPQQDVSINLISLFAFILVLGILVDDAIVVGESIYSARATARDGLEAAIRGVQRVSVPVIFGVLTTIVAFIPALNVPGTSGKIWRVIPVVVIAALVFSLIEAMLILPSHLSHAKVGDASNRRRRLPVWVWFTLIPLWGYVQRGMSAGLEWFVQNIYRRILALAVRWRYVTLAGGVATLFLCAGLVAGGFIKYEFFPPVEADDIVATIRMPEGTPVETTRGAVSRMVRALDAVDADLKQQYGMGIFRNRLINIGEHPQRDRRAANPTGSNLGAVQVELIPAEGRPLGANKIITLWREKLGEIPGADEVAFSGALASVGAPINIQLSGPGVDELDAVGEQVKEKLSTYQGVFDITDTFDAGKVELRLTLKPAGEALGISLADLARQVRDGFYGAEAQRIQRDREEVKVMVRYPQVGRQSVGNLEQMRIRTPAGEVAFADVANVKWGTAFATITRVDGNRALNITADVDDAAGNANQILADISATFLPELIGQHPGVRFSLEGQQREQGDTGRALFTGFILALFGIYALMAIPLKSYTQPALIMISIPFGIIGAIVGHVMMGLTLSMLSIIGIVALAGVVVNSALVLIDFINQHRDAEEKDSTHAVINAGVSRFRPIMLTSVTTFAGLTPMMLEKSLQAQFLIPMAISLAFGVLFSTVITLIGIPAAYMALEDIQRLLRQARHDYVRTIGPLVGLVPSGDPTPATPAFTDEAPR